MDGLRPERDLPPGRGTRWRVVLLCFLAQNCAMGLAFGSFGPLLASTEQQFGVSRALASAGMGVTMLAIGGLSPLLGSLLQRSSVRTWMIVGALLSAAGYAGLAVFHSFPLAVAMYALVGAGVCLLAILGPLVLVSRWFDDNRGKVLSLVNLPLMLFVTPYVIAEMLPRQGRFGVLVGMGAIFVLLIPALMLLVERPAGLKAPDKAGSEEPVAAESAASILRRPAFWLLSLGIGLVAGAGTGFVVHIVPFGVEKQMPLAAASGVLSVYAGAGILGTLLFGWIADRAGPAAALIISAGCQAFLWWALVQTDGPALYLAAALLGVCVVPLVTLHGAALSAMFGAASVGRAMGFSYSIKLPFIFVFAPAMGWMFQVLGTYRVSFLATAGLMAFAALSFCLMRLVQNAPIRLKA
jgi:MFS family permease